MRCLLCIYLFSPINGFNWTFCSLPPSSGTREWQFHYNNSAVGFKPHVTATPRFWKQTSATPLFYFSCCCCLHINHSLYRWCHTLSCAYNCLSSPEDKTKRDTINKHQPTEWFCLISQGDYLHKWKFTFARFFYFFIFAFNSAQKYPKW